VLAAQLVSGSGMLQQDREAPIDTAKENGRQAAAAPPPTVAPPPAAAPTKAGFR